jgi:hypothetical protein
VLAAARRSEREIGEQGTADTTGTYYISNVMTTHKPVPSNGSCTGRELALPIDRLDKNTAPKLASLGHLGYGANTIADGRLQP